MSTTDYLSALNWGTSTSGSAGSAESSTTLHTARLDARVPPDQYTVSGLQITRLVELSTAMSSYFKGGTRVRMLTQTSTPFGAGEYGVWVDNAAAPQPRFSAGTSSHYLMTATAIADPGNGGAIPVTYSGVCSITTGGSETRSVAAPTFIGQTLEIIIDVDGGVAVVTFASAINQAGNTIATLTEVKDMLAVKCMQVAGVKVWRVMANDGAALS